MAEAITREQAIDALKTVFDPEIPVNVWDLGLVYGLDLDDGQVAVQMTLTAPGCPVGPQIAAEIEQKLTALGASAVSVSFVWTPPWSTERVTPEGKLQLQMMGIPV
jgi:metal-sulfur cluster biosynthetic enzyme